jgi:hypothetical protein
MNMATKRENADLWRSGIVAYTIDGDVAVPGLSNEAIHSLNEPFALTSRHIECRSNARQLQPIQQLMPTTRPWPG